jgi:hypothetical protein
MRYTAWLFVGVALLLCMVPAQATTNEVLNGDFGTGTLVYWQHGVDIDVGIDGPGHDWAATCKNPGGDLWLRQIVDDTASPDWNPALHRKEITVTADLAWSGWVGAGAEVKFRLDWWAESYNNVTDPTTLPYYSDPMLSGSDPAQGYFVSDWVSYDLSGLPALQWLPVTPFDERLLDVQPRWVSLEVVYTQPAGTGVWMDNVTLTGKCIPEPSSLLALFGGCGVLLAGLRRSRR